MLTALKKTSLGKALYRLSRHKTAGAPLRWLLATLRHEQLDPAHLLPANRAHNSQQEKILATFEQKTVPRS